MDSERQQEYKQTQQTEKLIEEMLRFLETSNEDDTVHVMYSNNGKQEANNEEVGNDPYKFRTEIFENREIFNEFPRLNERFPIWNTKDIVAYSNKKSISLPQSPSGIDEPIWRRSSLSTLNKSDDLVVEHLSLNFLNGTGDNMFTRLESNCRRSSNNAYVQEVHKAIYGDTSGHPTNDSLQYHQAAQNYAIYGKELLDFPQDMNALLSDAILTEGDKGNCGSGLYPIPGYQGPGVFVGCSLSENFPIQNAAGFGKSSTSTYSTIGTTSTTVTSMVGPAASAAAYYQLCNMQTQARSAATSYNMFLGNKVNYVAASPITAPQLVYNQHTSQATTNFISNSLANAALATSPAILYNNPVLTTTTQQYLNAFFKETQNLSSASAAATLGCNASQANSHGLYERLIYAQMLQQQIYQQHQQAAVIAARLQYKQRLAAANVVSRLPNMVTNGNTTNTNGAPQSPSNAQQAIPVAGGSSLTQGNLNCCGRQAAWAGNNLPDVLLLNQNQSPMTVNEGEESLKIVQD